MAGVVISPVSLERVDKLPLKFLNKEQFIQLYVEFSELKWSECKDARRESLHTLFHGFVAHFFIWDQHYCMTPIESDIPSRKRFVDNNYINWARHRCSDFPENKDNEVYLCASSLFNPYALLRIYDLFSLDAAKRVAEGIRLFRHGGE